MTAEDVDVTAMHIELNELKSQFDQGMREGEAFGDMKKVYMKIKELECHLKVIAWEVDKGRNGDGYSRIAYPLL